jgi:hypothetical protein
MSFHVTPDTRNRLSRVRYSIGDLLRRPNLTLEELDLISAELTNLASKATDLLARRKSEADPSDRS